MKSKKSQITQQTALIILGLLLLIVLIYLVMRAKTTGVSLIDEFRNLFY